MVVKDLLSRLGETPEVFTGRSLFMSMFNDISCGTKDNERESLANAQVVIIYAEKFGIGQRSFIGPRSEKKWYSIEEDSPQGIWDHIAEKMLLEFAEGTCPIFRATTPLSRGQLRSKRRGNCRHILLQILKQLRPFFAYLFLPISSVSTEQSRTCEKNMNPITIDQGNLIKVMGQSIVLSEIKTEVLLENDDPAYQNFVLQQYEERIERLTQHDRSRNGPNLETNYYLV